MKTREKENVMGKKILAISTGLRANSNSETLLDSFIEGAKEAGNDVEKITLKGKVFAGGVNDAGEIANHPALKQAYKLGLKA